MKTEFEVGVLYPTRSFIVLSKNNPNVCMDERKHFIRALDIKSIKREDVLRKDAFCLREEEYSRRLKFKTTLGRGDGYSPVMVFDSIALAVFDSGLGGRAFIYDDYESLLFHYLLRQKLNDYSIADPKLKEAIAGKEKERRVLTMLFNKKKAINGYSHTYPFTVSRLLE